MGSFGFGFRHARAGARSGGGSGTPTPTPTPTPTSSYSAEAEAYFAAMTTQPDATRKGLINDLIVSAKAGANAWSALDRLALLASHDSQSALLDAHDPTKTASAVNSPTFTVDRGFAGDGASSYIDFGEAPNAVGNQFSLNSATIGVWINVQSAANGLRSEAGQSGSVFNMSITARNTTGNETFKANDATLSVARANSGTRLGHRASVRADSATKKSYLNGGAETVVSLASTSISAGNITILRVGNAYSDDGACVAYSGAALTATQEAELHTALATYLTAIGAI